MIDVRVTEIGGEAIKAALDRAPEVLRSRLVHVMNEEGKIAQTRARSAAPYNPNRDPKRGGTHIRDAIRYFAWSNPQRAELVVRAVGGARGAPHAHLIERGVERQKIRVYRGDGVRASKLRWLKGGGFKKPRRATRVFMYTRMHQIKAQPFFDPAIQSLGDVGAKLQEAVNQAAADVNGGA